MKKIVAALPTVRPYAEAFWCALFDSLETPLEGVEVLIKCHPWLPPSRFSTPRRPFKPWLRLDDRPLPELLAEAAGFIYVPQTASWWEAYAAGLPVAKFLPDLLDIDTDEGLPDGAVISCEAPQLRETLARLAASPRRSPSKELLREFFGPVKDDVWRRVAGL